MRLDHVALASRDASAAVAALVGELGGTVLSGGASTGFRFVQVHLGDVGAGMKVELLEPWDVEGRDFLERFLRKHGPGPHHLTFKVDDLAATLERVRAAGRTPVSVALSDPTWKEAFLLPAEAHGTVVQLAESNDTLASPYEEYRHALEHGVAAERIWWTAPPVRAPAVSVLRRVVMATPSLDETTEFFTGLLDGEAWGAAPRGEQPPWVELAWPGGGRIRLEERVDATPGIVRLELDGSGPARELDVSGTHLVVGTAS